MNGCCDCLRVSVPLPMYPAPSYYAGNDASMTADVCYALCATLGYTYFGTQHYYECFCDNDYGSLGTSSDCTTACGGDSNEICGGAYANSVYMLLAPTAMPTATPAPTLTRVSTPPDAARKTKSSSQGGASALD